MNVSAILNPEQRVIEHHSHYHNDQSQLTPPPSPTSLLQHQHQHQYQQQTATNSNGKPRSRFSDIEDSIICEGVARGLTWGQISHQLPHRKRATCFNRYRTLQGIRKPRRRLSTTSTTFTASSKTASSSSSSPPWIPSTPPDSTSSSLTNVAYLSGFHLPSPRQILLISDEYLNSKEHLPPLITPATRYAFNHHR